MNIRKTENDLICDNKQQKYHLLGIPFFFLSMETTFPERTNFVLSREMQKGVNETLEDVFGSGRVCVIPYFLPPDAFIEDYGRLMGMAQAYFEDGVSVALGQYAAQQHDKGVTFEIYTLPVVIKGTRAGGDSASEGLTECCLADVPECVVIFMDGLSKANFPQKVNPLIRPEVGTYIGDMVNRLVAYPENATASIANPTLVSHRDYGFFIHMIAREILKAYQIDLPVKKRSAGHKKKVFLMGQRNLI